MTQQMFKKLVPVVCGSPESCRHVKGVGWGKFELKKLKKSGYHNHITKELIIKTLKNCDEITHRSTLCAAK